MRTASTPDLSRIAAITAVAVTSILLQVLSRTLEEISMLLLDFQWASQVARNANANTLPYAHMRAHARTHTRTPERTHACPHALETTEHETSDCWHVCVCVCVLRVRACVWRLKRPCACVCELAHSSVSIDASVWARPVARLFAVAFAFTVTAPAGYVRSNLLWKRDLPTKHVSQKTIATRSL